MNEFEDKLHEERLRVGELISAILGVEGYQRLKDWLKRKKRQSRL